jgi:hypothetical protein
MKHSAIKKAIIKLIYLANFEKCWAVSTWRYKKCKNISAQLTRKNTLISHKVGSTSSQGSVYNIFLQMINIVSYITLYQENQIKLWFHSSSIHMSFPLEETLSKENKLLIWVGWYPLTHISPSSNWEQPHDMGRLTPPNPYFPSPDRKAVEQHKIHFNYISVYHIYKNCNPHVSGHNCPTVNHYFFFKKQSIKSQIW